jgi:DNA polymerase I-like protein with 3'-5' exonuclease and polymerase domains
MRERGVLVDLERAGEYREKLSASTGTAAERLREEEIDAWANATIKKYCERKHIEHLWTEDGNPSFPSAWLEKHDDIVLRSVADVRRIEKNVGTFITSAIIGEACGDRLHCQFNPLKSDDFGTVSGRFSSSNPNLQNIPARDEELGPMIRGLFMPDHGDVWASDDWSQIEFRLLVHYAALDKLQGAEKTLMAFIDDPNTDFHEWTAELASIERKPAKNINFGLVYGMGKNKLARSLGLEMEDANGIFNKYHSALPFVKKLFNNVKRRAGQYGYIRTYLGRRRRYPMWEPSDWAEAQDTSPVPFEKARELWMHKNFRDQAWITEEVAGKAGESWGGGQFGIKRAKTFTGLNGLLQGSAADLMKIAMVDIWESGVCDVLGAPLLTVHDELNWSVPDTTEGREAHDEAVRIMRLDGHKRIRIPLIVSSDTGENWAAAK